MPNPQKTAMAALAALCLVMGPVLTHVAHARPFPFAPGETLTYALRWEAVPAGQATLAVAPMASFANQTAWHFVMTAHTNAFVDFFYKVRDRIDAHTDAALDKSLHFSQIQREGSYHRDIDVAFDWTRLRATYSNRGEPRDPIVIYPGTYDVLSIFYAFRLMPVATGARLAASVTDGKKNVIGYADVHERVWITTPAGEFDTYRIIPDLQHLGGVFKKSDDAILELWVTADGRNIPVRIKSKVVVGSFYADLIELREGIGAGD
ncbi:MAG: DUF3108 domain-containing protein [Desulfovibrionaceae bacterium]